MNAQDAKDYLPLVLALSEGKTLQCKTICHGSEITAGWFDLIGYIGFENPASHYRIKPEPRRYWIFKMSNVLYHVAFNQAVYETFKNNPGFSNAEIIEVQEVIK